MKDIDELLRQSPKPSRQLKANFTDTVMAELRANPTLEKQVGLKGLYMKFKHLPRVAAVAIALAATASIGGAAYAAYTWITPEVTVTNVTPNNDDNRREYTIDAQCTEYNSGKNIQYELPRGSKLTDEDVQKVLKNTCAYSTLSEFIRGTWKGDENGAAFAKKKVGDIVTVYDWNSPENKLEGGSPFGTITAITDKTITLTQSTYYQPSVFLESGSQPQYYSGAKVSTRTYNFVPDYQVWQDGIRRKAGDIRVGDTVRLVTREHHKVQYYEDIRQNGIGAQVSFGIAGVVKTSIDPKYVKGIGDPAITNQLALLEPCGIAQQYRCVVIGSASLVPIYMAGIQDSGSVGDKNLRPDAQSKEVQRYALQGRIIAINGKTFTIKMRGQADTATITLPYDAIKLYNNPVVTPGMSADEKRHVEYMLRVKPMPVEVGDLVEVMYVQRSNENHLVVQSRDLIQVMPITYELDGQALKY